ncbi:MAG: uracil-DNA glycosylase [Ruminiclostridium sp.]|nr:uracil-DNA glycosylase [Ruminiclostridium sp.]
MDFLPVILPEDKAPAAADDYKQCEICTDKSRIIWGEGNPKAPITIILDNPGARENKEGKAYICGTRETLQSAIYHANLKLEDIYVTYLLKCRPLRKYDKVKARAFNKPFLFKQIQTMQPKFLVCLGDTVVQSLFNDSEAHIKNLRGVWHEILGIPAFVSYHPLAVRRRPNLAYQFQDDWMMLTERFNQR